MRDVALAAGVSSTSVSFVLNDRRGARIADETRARILAAAEDLGFRPNLTARQLRLQQTHTIGLITDGIASSPFAGQIVRAAHDVAWQAGRLVFLVNTSGDVDVEATAVRELIDRRADGLIFAATVAGEIAAPAEMAAVPTVLINCSPRAGSTPFPAVIPAERFGAELATQHLIDAGHRDIVYLAGDEHAWATQERRAGFRDRMRTAGLRVATGSVLHGPYTIDSGYDRAFVVLGRDDRPSALLCGNDRIAVGALLAAQKLGLDVPRDLSLVGYDDQEELADRVRPSLTTVSLPHYRMGELGMRALLALIAGAEVPPRQEVRGELIERNSVAPPSAARP
jgi:Transcriptional regulators